MGTVTNVIYYGIFAAFTGGWLPVRSKRPNRLLVISHLYAFLIFIAAPLTVFLVSQLMEYCVFVQSHVCFI